MRDSEILIWRLHNDPEPVVESDTEPDHTPPRHENSTSIFDADDRSTIALGDSSPSRASSKASKPSRNSSPRKQFRNAELQQAGFRTASFEDEIKLPSLEQLRRDLIGIQRGDRILPQGLRAQLDSKVNIPWFAYSESKDSTAYRYPGLEEIRHIFRRAKKCHHGHHGESSWNMDVHSKLFEWVLREGPESSGPLDYRYCRTAGVLPQYRPPGASSNMVDFCLAIEVNAEEGRMINSLCRSRPALSINHTDWGDLSRFPIAISVKAKGYDDPYDTVLLQVATWHAAQWRSLRWGGKALSAVEFLAGIIVIGHDWRFVATVLGEDDRTTTLESIPIGGTDSIFAMYTLFAALQRLKRWAESTYWPAFKCDMLGDTEPEG
ncbi:hypothetical protein NOR_08335 [Metarhizium rileyi]|uniref:PD-(D/E)XK nuclease-like domain-containing protein n=1 Tax=Metarhizium rileyi (strain RCEF 4871) TaxID=1649241 RepID=A0A166WGQ8_METRR|nr:hypothetical protein NOR_08335 [Metarhizium rileyi RCEF 4871]